MTTDLPPARATAARTTVLNRRRRSRSLRRKSLMLATAVVGSMPLMEEPAAAQSYPTVWSYNICGGSGCGHNGANFVLDPIKWWIGANSSHPISIGLQEVCAPEVNDFKNFLRARDNRYYAAHHQQFRAAAECGTPGTLQKFGPATFARAGTNPYDVAGRVQNITFNNQADAETRGFACLRAGFATLYWSCSAHMTPYSSLTAGQQFNQYATWINARGKAFWTGDMYVSPNQMPNVSPGFSFDTHRHGDLCLPGTNTYRWTHRNKANGALRAYDHAFRSRGLVNCSQDQFLHPTNSWDMYPVGTFPSDHRLIGAYFPS